MSNKSKLINNNQKLNSNNIKLMAIKNAFLKPLPKYNGLSTPTFGTDTETSFDIYTINRDTKTIKITRYGAGNDREFSY